MAVHDLGGGAKVDVHSVSGTFAPTAAVIEPSLLDHTPIARYQAPDTKVPKARIRFEFTPTNVPRTISFGVKQFIMLEKDEAIYRGNKPLDGHITVRYRPPARVILDCASDSLEILWEPMTDTPTGARASAVHAPFYSEEPVPAPNGVRASRTIEDAPGGSYPLEMRNGSNDRLNYLEEVRVRQVFLTVLTAVTPSEHIPLEAAFWQSTIDGRVTWTNGVPNVLGISRTNAGRGQFADLGERFLVIPLEIMKDKRLTAADTMNQKQNDAMFAARGRYKVQNWDKPPKKEVIIESAGFSITQSPEDLARP